MSQPGIVSNIVRHYIEETSASIIPAETNPQLTDIKSLMGGGALVISPTVALSAIYEGQGGTEENAPPEIYTIQDSSIQAIDSVSTDYLNDIKPNKII